MAIEKLRNNQPVTGTMVRLLRHPAIAKIAHDAGFDMIMIDMEHGAYNFDTVTDIVLAARPLGLTVMVRVPELSKGYVSRALDCGVSGVMVPMLESVEQAEQLVKWSKYPPLGGRGLGSIGGNSGFTRPGPAVEYMAETNRNVIAIAQIETKQAVDCINDIAAVEGIDALVVGPNDLANSLGHPGDLTCESEDAAIATIAEAAHKAGKHFGIHAGINLLERWTKHNMTIVMNSIDSNALVDGMVQLQQQAAKLVDR